MYSTSVNISLYPFQQNKLGNKCHLFYYSSNIMPLCFIEGKVQYAHEHTVKFLGAVQANNYSLCTMTGNSFYCANSSHLFNICIGQHCPMKC